jgi:hypothetical protein
MSDAVERLAHAIDVDKEALEVRSRADGWEDDRLFEGNSLRNVHARF